MVATEIDRQANAILQEALELPTAEQSGYVAERCADDSILLQRVDGLLGADTGPLHPFRDAALVCSQRNESLVGKQMGSYELIEEIGHGGMGEVYLAERCHGEHRRQVAVKLLKPGMHSKENLRRFSKEGQIIAKLEHPNIARLYDSSSEGCRPYLVMEYVVGKPIDVYCDAEELSIRDRLELFLKVCAAVEFAHHHLVVHRDLKPSNILVTPEGEPMLLDFGISKLLDAEAINADTATQVLAMTPQYASPEQVRGEMVSTSSDLYSLGVLLFELLTGQRPYDVEGRTQIELVRLVCEAEPRRPSVVVQETKQDSGVDDSQTPIVQPLASLRGLSAKKLRKKLRGELDIIVLKALRKEPDKRYISVDRFAEDIRRHIKGHPIRARRGAFGYKAGKFLQRHKVGVISMLFLLSLIVTFVSYLVVQRQDVVRALSMAQSERDKLQAVSEFHNALFTQFDPYENTADMSVRDFLSRREVTLKSFEPYPELFATNLNSLGKAYRNLGIFDSATPLLEKALEVRRSSLGNDHPDVGESLYELGVLLNKKRELVRAEEALNDAAEIQENFGSDRLALAATLEQLAYSVVHQHRFSEAEQLGLRALEIKENILGPDHAEVGMILGTLADLHRFQGRLAEAEPLYQRSLAITEDIFGSDHPLVANLLSQVALLKQDLGQNSEAEALFRRTLLIRQDALGVKHPDYGLGLDALAYFYETQERFAEARPLLERSLSISEMTHGKQGLWITSVLVSLGKANEYQGHYAEAGPFYLRALAIFEEEIGVDHISVSVTLAHLGRLRLRQGRALEAEEYLGRASRIAESQLADGHWRVAYLNAVRGACLTVRGSFEEAEALLLESYAIITDKKGPRSNASKHALEWLIDLYEARGMQEMANNYSARLEESNS